MNLLIFISIALTELIHNQVFATVDSTTGMTTVCGNTVSVKLTKDFIDRVFELESTHGLKVGIDNVCKNNSQTEDTNLACNGLHAANGSWSFDFPIGSCNPTTQIENKMLIYKYRIKTVVVDRGTSMITRFICRNVEFRCSFPREYEILTSKYVISEEEEEPEEKSSPAVQSFSLYMALTDENWIPLTRMPLLAEGDYIYIYIGLHPSAPPGFLLQASTCTVYNQFQTESYLLIDSDGCKETNDQDQPDSIVISQKSGDSIRFQFRAFYWSNPSQLGLYIYCRARICNSYTSSCEMSTCNRKRSIVEPNQEKLLKLGPVVMKPNDPCLENKGFCDDICYVVGDVITCSCAQGRVLSSYNHRSCHNLTFPETREVTNERVYPKTARNLFNEDNGDVVVDKKDFKYLLDSIKSKNHFLVVAGIMVLLLTSLLIISVYKNYRK